MTELHTEWIFPEQERYAQITKLLPEIFPKEELMPENMTDELAPYLCFYDGDLFIGFAQVLKKPDLHYLRYMVILEEFRSKGYGGKMLDKILSERGRAPLVLDVEPPDERAENHEQRLRRIRFYRKHGMVNSGYIFMYGNNPFIIMTTGEEEAPVIMQRYFTADRRFAPGYIRILKSGEQKS